MIIVSLGSAAMLDAMGTAKQMQGIIFANVSTPLISVAAMVDATMKNVFMKGVTMNANTPNANPQNTSRQ